MYIRVRFRVRVSFRVRVIKKKIKMYKNLDRLTPLKAIYIPTQSASRSDWNRLGGLVMFQIETAKRDIHFGDSLIYIYIY